MLIFLLIFKTVQIIKLQSKRVQNNIAVFICLLLKGKKNKIPV